MQTAVEFLDERYRYIRWMRLRDEISAEVSIRWSQDALRQAREMETQQILKAHEAGSYTANETIPEAKANACKYFERAYGTNKPKQNQ